MSAFFSFGSLIISVDPSTRPQIYVGTVNSGSYVTATADGSSLEYLEGSVLMVERLA